MDFLINLLILLLVGYILGSERANSHNLIGIRTVTLILLGAFVFTYISSRVGGDPARIVAQVVTGTGFIGAGIIFKDGIKNVHNLTTAVLVWVLAALGCLISLSMRIESLVITIIIYIVLRIYKKIFDYDR
jgi:putative Mg2+ transporter-C (MgtC) family protein